MDNTLKKWLIENNFILLNNIEFCNINWAIQFGVYQKYFWETKHWWLTIYLYTDKFGGKIEKYPDETIYKCDFITNSPIHAQKQLVSIALKLLNENN